MGSGRHKTEIPELLLTLIVLMRPSHASSAGKSELPPPAETIHVAAARLDQRAQLGGGGLMRPIDASQAMSVVSKPFIDTQAPLASAFQLVSAVPGANTAASDPFGISPYTNISVRGLNSDAIGFTLEGTPLNDIAYYGAYPAQFADSENLQTITLTQGAPQLASPVLNAAGGLMALAYITPAKEAGGTISASYGAFANSRQFLRLQTGEIGRTGLRAFMSYSHTTAHNWRGPGTDSRQHVDLKLLQRLGTGSQISLIGSWNRMIASYYPQVTRDAFRAYGNGGPNNLSRWYDGSDPSKAAQFYRLWRAPEQTFYAGLPSIFSLTDSLTLTVTPYAQAAYGSVASGTTLPSQTVDGSAQPFRVALGDRAFPVGPETIVRANGTQESYRSGLNAHLDVATTHHVLTFGAWYDYSDDREAQSFTTVGAEGYAPAIWARSQRGLVRLPGGQPLYGSAFHTIGQVSALYIIDRVTLLQERLKLEAGFKDVMYAIRGTNDLPGPQYHTGGSYHVPLPRLALRYRFRPQHQLFGNVTTNFRTPSSTAFYNYYDVTSGNITTDHAQNLKAEYSISEEIGYRYEGGHLLGSLTFFNYNFTNRLITTEIFRSGAPVQTTINAGGQTSRGVDVELSVKPWHNWSPYLSAEYLHATIDNDIISGDDLVPTRGKTAVRSPKFQGAAGLSFDDGHLFGMAVARYTGRQFATFMNDVAMPGFVSGDLALGYRFSDNMHLKAPTVRLNMINIGNIHYLSGVSQVSLAEKDTMGRRGTTITGADPLFYIGSGFALLFTAGSDF